jgi:hypothetical protein
MTTTVPTTGDEERLVGKLRADNDWLMRSRLVGHELRALEAGNNCLQAADLITRLRQERDEARLNAAIIEGVSNELDIALTASNAEAERLRADIAQATDLMRKAHAVMRECGWQLAISAEPAGDGIIEAACTEIEADFGEFLAARALQGSAKQ